MATKRTLGTIFSYFETGDVPTQTQYEDAWFSMRHKDDPVTIPEVTNLADAITGISTTKTNGQTISIPAGAFVDVVFVKSVSAGDVKIESGAGLENVVPLTTFSAGQVQVFRCDFYTAGAATWTVTSPGSVTVLYFKRQITI